METPNQQKDILNQRIDGLMSQMKTLIYPGDIFLRLDLYYEIENTIFEYRYGKEN